MNHVLLAFRDTLAVAANVDSIWGHNHVLNSLTSHLRGICTKASAEVNSDPTAEAHGLIEMRHGRKRRTAETRVVLFVGVEQHHIVVGDPSTRHRTIGTMLARLVCFIEKYSESTVSGYRPDFETIQAKVQQTLIEAFPHALREDVGRIYDAKKGKFCETPEEYEAALYARLYKKMAPSIERTPRETVRAYRLVVASLPDDREDLATLREEFVALLDYVEQGLVNHELTMTGVNGLLESLDVKWARMMHDM